jgi:riboflavin synthase
MPSECGGFSTGNWKPETGNYFLMFTGIIAAVGTVETLERAGTGARLRISAAQNFLERAKVGDSIAVSGCCVTITELGSGRNKSAGRSGSFSADLSEETLRRTSFAKLAAGRHLNLEHPLRVGDEMGGHIVQGHVDAVGTVVALEPVSAVSGKRSASGADAPDGQDANAAGWWWRVRLPEETQQSVVSKGSIAVEGISLTVAGIDDDVVSFAVIPFTYTHTNLASLAPGDLVNIEFDVIGRYVERLLEPYRASGARESLSARALMRELRRQGF